MSSADAFAWSLARLQAAFSGVCPVLSEGIDFKPAKGYDGYEAFPASVIPKNGYMTVGSLDIKDKPIESGDGRYEVLMRLQIRIFEPANYGGAIYRARRDQLRNLFYQLKHYPPEPRTWWLEHRAEESPARDLGRQEQNVWSVYSIHYYLWRTEIRSQVGAVA